MNTSFGSRITQGWQLANTTFQFAIAHKTSFLFMIWSPLRLIILILGGLFLYSHQAQFHITLPAVMTIMLALLIFLSFLTSFMQIALSFYVSETLKGNNPTFESSLERCYNQAFTIFMWVVCGTLVARFVSCFRTSQGRPNFLGGGIKTSWRILTYFVVPIIALEQKNIFDAIKQSMDLVKKTWGESLGAQLGVRIIFNIFGFFALLPLILISSAYWSGNIQDQTIPYAIAISTVPLLILNFFRTTIIAILKTVLYHYAQHKPVGPFPQKLLHDVFVSTSQK